MNAHSIFNQNNSTTLISEIITQPEAAMLEWYDLLSHFMNLCSTDIGKQYCQNITPLSFESIAVQYKKINCIKELLRMGYYPDFSGITDISVLVVKASKGSTLTLDELCKVRSFLVAQHRVITFFSSLHVDITVLTELDKIEPCTSLHNLLRNSITENGNLNEYTYPTLRHITREINEIRNSIEKACYSILHSPAYQHIIQEKQFTIKNNRYVLPIKTQYKHVIKGTILDISSSKATLFIEPDSIHELNNTLLYKELELQREIERILHQLSSEIGTYSHTLITNLSLFAYIDFLTALARFAITYNAHTPAVVEQPCIDCIDARHPLLAIIQKDAVVPASFAIGKPHRCLIISGVNSGGKTVLLKTLGLFALMVKYGLPITAHPDSTVGLFDKIFVDIGDDQNLLQSLSTFSGQIKNVVRILHEANEKSLVLIDEIIVGTDPIHGAAIAQAVLEYLVDKNVTVAVTTHYAQLKEIPLHDNRFYNVSVIFDIERMQPTYHLLLGMPGASYTIEIAKNFSLPEEIINRALSLLNASTVSVDALLSKIAEHTHMLHNKEMELQQLKEELQKVKEEYSRKINELQATIERITVQQATTLLDELKAYKEKIVEHIRQLQSTSMKEATALLHEVTHLQNKINQTLRPLQKPNLETIACTPETAKKGVKVYVRPLQNYGIIEDVDTKDNTVKVRMGSFTSRFSFDDILCVTTPQPQQHISKQTKATFYEQNAMPVTIQTQHNTIDLRGLRVDEAITRLEYELDSMVQKNIRAAVVIHGHGTGSLKKAVREYAQYSWYVTSYRPGEQEEGGDGVTILYLR